jgi:hypothetical protein
MNNKFTMACARILAKRGYEKPNRIMQMYGIIKLIERICDEYKYICDLLADYNKPISKQVLNYFKSVIEFYENFYNLFYKFSKEGKKKNYLGRKELMNEGQKLLEKSKGKESVLISILIKEVEKIYNTSGEYFALLL